MIKRVTIDIDLITKKGYKIDDYFALLAMYYGAEINSDTYKRITQEGYLDFDALDEELPIGARINDNGKIMLEDVILDSEIKETKDTNNGVVDRFSWLADQLRALYPAGKKPGTSFQWRDSTAIIAKRLKALVASYNCEFTDEEAIEATKRYVASFNGNYQYMQLLKYFISKKVIIDGAVEPSSQLLSYIENANDVDSSNTTWTDTLV
jgi:hypothetical protein